MLLPGCRTPWPGRQHRKRLARANPWNKILLASRPSHKHVSIRPAPRRGACPVEYSHKKLYQATPPPTRSLFSRLSLISVHAKSTRLILMFETSQSVTTKAAVVAPALSLVPDNFCGRSPLCSHLLTITILGQGEFEQCHSNDTLE